MRRTPTILDVLAVATALVLSVGLAGCGGSSAKGAAPSSVPKTTSAPAAGGGGGGGGKVDPCGLLSDADVTAVIGAHKAGATGLLAGGLYGDDSCVWKSTTTVSAIGEADSVEAAVLTGTTASEARAQDADQADPLPAFGHNARYDQSYGRLWFDCGSGEFCNVRVNTTEDSTHSGDTRQGAAEKLGREILGKV